MIRLFTALRIPFEIRQQIIELEKIICPDYNNYKWEPIDKLHLTLKFIGSVEEKYLDKIISTLTFIEEFESFNCSFSKLGLFFRFKEPKIFWLSLESVPPMKPMAKQIDKEMRAFSVPEEKKDFKSHITLLRIKNSIDDVFKKNIENIILPKVNFLIKEAVLFESKLKPTGSIYNELKTYELK